MCLSYLALWSGHHAGPTAACKKQEARWPSGRTPSAGGAVAPPLIEDNDNGQGPAEETTTLAVAPPT
jgi:hypothetical protein